MLVEEVVLEQICSFFHSFKDFVFDISVFSKELISKFVHIQSTLSPVKIKCLLGAVLAGFGWKCNVHLGGNLFDSLERGIILGVGCHQII